MAAENPYMIKPTLRADLSRAQTLALAVGVVGVVLTLIEVFLSPQQFFRSWAVGFLLPFSLGIGGLACLMLQYMTGGAWGMVIRRQLEAASRTMPLILILFIPFIFGAGHLYDWMHPDLVSRDPVMREKAPYLNFTWWLIRSGIVFAVWLIYMLRLNALSKREEETGSMRDSLHLMGWSGIGLVIYAFSMTCAVTDWYMSMNVHWFSTIYGLIYLGGQGLSIVSCVIIATTYLMRDEPLSFVITKRHLHDLGKLLFMFTLFWTYVSFGQLLIIWSGNLPDENNWYVARMNGGWGWIASFLVFFQWMLPFLILLSQRIKRNPKTLRMMAFWVIVVRMVDMIWLVEPNYHPQHLFVNWSDVTALIGLGGLWVAYFCYQLKQRPLIPINAPDLQRALAHGRAH